MKRIVVSLLFVLFASPSLAQQAAGEIEKAVEQFAHAFNTGDAAAIGQMYTEQATVLPPGAEMIKGRQAAQKFWQDAVRDGFKNLSLKVVEVEDYGTAAREIGRFGLDAPNQQGQASRVEGKYVVVWKKIDGDWKLDTDIWNMDK